MHALRFLRSATAVALVTALAFSLAPGVPAAPAQAASASRNTDFNGDGYNDLAFGAPNYPGYQGTDNSGMVGVLYGGPGGLAGQQIIRPLPGCVTGPFFEGEMRGCNEWGRGLAASDIDGDGRSDLAFAGRADAQVMAWKPTGIQPVLRAQRTLLSAPFEPVHLMAGQVDGQLGNDLVRPSDDRFYSFSGWYNFSQQSQGYSYPNEPWSCCGGRIPDSTAADVDGDGKLETALLIESGWRSGKVWLLVVDDPHQLRLSTTTLSSPDSCSPPTLDGSVDVCPKIDSRTAFGDVNGDGRLDVVLATPSTGWLQVWYGSTSGFPSRPGFAARVSWMVSDVSDDGVHTDQLSQHLAVGDIDGDGAAEIAVGSGVATVSGQAQAGHVALVPGSGNGPVLAKTRIITQDGITPYDQPQQAPASARPPVSRPAPTATVAPAVNPPSRVTAASGGTPAPEPGSPAATADPIGEQSAAGDNFGRSIVILDVTGDGRPELIVGAPGKYNATGMLAVFRGGPTGIATDTAQLVFGHQVKAGAPGGRFGQRLLQ